MSAVRGPLLFVQDVAGVGFHEQVELRLADGQVRHGTVLQVSESVAVVEVFEGTFGLAPEQTRVRFTGSPLEVAVGRGWLGRTVDGLGRPLDGGPPVVGRERRDANGSPINPTARARPEDPIETGVSAVDLMNTLVRGQKLPIFSAGGLPHDELATQIATQARLPGRDEAFCVVFVALGVRHDDAAFFRRAFEESEVLDEAVLVISLADDPPIERLAAPRVALTIAEHLAFDEGRHVLGVLTDMTNYCDALREASAARGEIPSRKGYPGYLYSDLASIYERCGRIEGRPGSITQVPVLTMPNDDITHPVPDLTGYITEGQLVLSRELHRRGVYPPVDVGPSLSRLMKDGIGSGRTREDHFELAGQLYALHARAGELRMLAEVVGEDALSGLDRAYLGFGSAFETRLVSQRQDERRGFERSLDIGWELAATLPERELRKTTPETRRRRLPKEADA